ncbi:Dcp2, box A domain [Carpediemonas membranifera]|uniref:Dcp2, box A domain n=1 Tax=Carpediemonas membranifera TaxID=201153 RepID=A0A8J6B8Z7_9EUKA|nr:Dcp2, box A domain [Carpediemonas membranifera]|eukprot:KAG9395669.1 Dcp2, box A domain [Carpediemonas membranifera]
MGKRTNIPRDGENAAFDDEIEDLITRFIFHIPETELAESNRFLHHVEKAHWSYIDDSRSKNPKLPHLKWKDFVRAFVDRIPASVITNIKDYDLEENLKSFAAYQGNIPTRGIIALSADCRRALFIESMACPKCWSLPKGKREEDESDFDCAIREAREETGFDFTPFVRPESQQQAGVDYIEMKEKKIRGHVIFYIARAVPEDYDYQPTCRGEVSSIRFHRIDKAIKNERGIRYTYLAQCVLKQLPGVIANLPGVSNGKTRRGMKRPQRKEKPLAVEVCDSEDKHSSILRTPVAPVGRCFPEDIGRVVLTRGPVADRLMMALLA